MKTPFPSNRSVALRIFLFVSWVAAAGAAPWITDQAQPRDFPLVRDGRAASLVFSVADFKVVDLAVNDLAADIARVSGVKPVVGHEAGAAQPMVVVGTVGRSPLIDGLVAAGKLDGASLRGKWETFLIATVTDPFPGVPQALVIAGSDRRGTAFGVYELSQAIGVSPWYWWADVAPAPRKSLAVVAGTRRFGPPSVQYRGIFLNDEDWGLHPWAARTFEPETGDIGPKTYARVCELLLRLKANTLWPAMHPCTKAFNLYPRNKEVADDYAIVMGSSHAEPMLRDNVTEWTAPPADYNYVTNRAGVRKYWEERVVANGRFENIYTLGMRGIHDSTMQGPKTDAERIRVLGEVFADQRALLAQHVNPDLAAVPQMFCAYKEVLDLYRQGLAVPADVTIVWPDDNYGYIRSFATPEERKRPGGFGVYYHLSYLGRPLAYLWLSTTPPALIWEEMSKAYDHGAQKIWIANVGDLKPAEIDTEFFLSMAWDIHQWRADNLPEFLVDWGAREFGRASAPAIAGVMAEYYRLNFVRRPEHLQWWLPGQPPQPSPYSAAEIDARLAAWQSLRVRAEQLAAGLPEAKRDAFEELVGYPVRGAALANQRYFWGERGRTAEAVAADAELKESTRHFNEDLAGGKWNHLLALEPADQEWKSMRLSPWIPPEFGPRPPAAPPAFQLEIAAPAGTTRPVPGGPAWEEVPGLGLAVLPTTAPAVDTARIARGAPRVDYTWNAPAAGEYALKIFLLPTHPLSPTGDLRLAVSANTAPVQMVVGDVPDGSAAWAQGVLNNYVVATATLAATSAGPQTLHVYGIGPDAVIERLEIERATLPAVP